tara:strand:+ start:438 stop:590 length:153 start_codon:yes stop_codon:yes gene_type:complete
MIGHLLQYTGGIPYRPPNREKKLKPQINYVNMVINLAILGTLVYVAIQVS